MATINNKISTKLLAIDLSQIELRVAAHVTQDKQMLYCYQNDIDIHTFTATLIFNLPPEQAKEKKYRRPAKEANFSILYGISASELSNRIAMPEWGETQCESLINRWFAMYPGVTAWINSYTKEIYRTGESRDIFGRRKLIPEVFSYHKWIREAGIRQGINNVIQSSAQQIIKQGMVDLKQVYPQFNDNEVNICLPLMQIHDELLFEVSTNQLETIIPLFLSIIEEAVKLTVPIKASAKVGERWNEMKEIN